MGERSHLLLDRQRLDDRHAKHLRPRSRLRLRRIHGIGADRLLHLDPSRRINYAGLHQHCARPRQPEPARLVRLQLRRRQRHHNASACRREDREASRSGAGASRAAGAARQPRPKLTTEQISPGRPAHFPPRNSLITHSCSRSAPCGQRITPRVCSLPAPWRRPDTSSNPRAAHRRGSQHSTHHGGYTGSPLRAPPSRP